MSKTNIVNNIGYYGSVVITFKNKGRKHSIKVHNEGTEDLGTLISIALCGDQRNINLLTGRCASRIGFQLRISDTEWRDLITAPSVITSSVWGPSVGEIENSEFQNNDNVIGVTQFSSVMSTGSVIRGYNVNSSYDMRLVLRNSRGEDLAYINELGTEQDRSLPLLYTALTNGQDALINWTMFILNYVEVKGD